MEFPVPVEERGEVLFQWGERREIVALAMLEADQLDAALLKESPSGGGLAGMISLGSHSYPLDFCKTTIKAAFSSCKVALSDDDMMAMRAEMGLNEFKDKAAQLILPVLLGEKKLVLYLTERKQAREALLKTSPSPGDAISASPLES
jgi:hypothetical protein